MHKHEKYCTKRFALLSWNHKTLHTTVWKSVENTTKCDHTHEFPWNELFRNLLIWRKNYISSVKRVIVFLTTIPHCVSVTETQIFTWNQFWNFLRAKDIAFVNALNLDFWYISAIKIRVQSLWNCQISSFWISIIPKIDFT